MYVVQRSTLIYYTYSLLTSTSAEKHADIDLFDGRLWPFSVQEHEKRPSSEINWISHHFINAIWFGHQLDRSTLQSGIIRFDDCVLHIPVYIFIASHQHHTHHGLWVMVEQIDYISLEWYRWWIHFDIWTHSPGDWLTTKYLENCTVTVFFKSQSQSDCRLKTDVWNRSSV